MKSFPLIFQIPVGVGTLIMLIRLLRFHRADPSTSLDKSALRAVVS